MPTINICWYQQKFYEQEKSMRICQKVMFLPQELMPIETLRTLLQKTHSISEIY